MRTKADSVQKLVFSEDLPILLVFYYLNHNRILNKSKFLACFVFVLIDPGSVLLRSFSGGSGGTSRSRKTLRATVRVMLRKKDKVLIKNNEIFWNNYLSFKTLLICLTLMGDRLRLWETDCAHRGAL